MTTVSTAENIGTYQLPSGLTLIVEEMPEVQSVALDLAIPGGIVLDGENAVGESLLLAELTARGAGNLGSKELSDAFDSRGIRHSEASSQDRFSYRCSFLADEIESALELVAMMVTNPILPPSEVDSIRSLFLQDLMSLKDNPPRWAMAELASRYYPQPYGRSGLGTEAGLRGADAASLRKLWENSFSAGGSILSIAGRCDRASVQRLVEKHFGKWGGSARQLPKFGSVNCGARHHVQFDAAQVQVVLAYPSAPFGHDLYFPAKIATQVLSGGMFGRLFIEVREKRGLCYAVYASHSSTKDYGTVTVYAGTTPERVQETLDVMLGELSRLKGTVADDELNRAKANFKTALVMSQESAAGRANGNTQEWWLDKRIRTLEEILDAIAAVTARQIDEYLEAFPVDRYSLLTLGSKALAVK